MLDNANVFLIGPNRKKQYIAAQENKILQTVLLDFVGTDDFPIMVIDLIDLEIHVDILRFLQRNRCIWFTLAGPHGLVLFVQYTEGSLANENLVRKTKKYLEEFEQNDGE